MVSFTNSEGPEAVISGFTITGGRGEAHGGIYCAGASPTITRNVITGNGPCEHYGAGIACYRASPLIAFNAITANRTWEGPGGIYCGGDSNATIIRNLIVSNEGDEGGISCSYSSPVIKENTIRLNRTWYSGGGICCSHSSPLIQNNVIADNAAGKYGGGMQCADSSVTVVNTTIADNWGSNSTGGLRSEDSSVSIVNRILWGNADDLAGCSATYSCIENVGGENEGEGNIHADPLFVDPAHGDYHLRGGSPCVDAGTDEASNIPPKDIDGEYRPFGLRVDMGADECVDQDEDSLPDFREIRNFANLWLDAEDDPDADDLPNSHELAHSTDPHSSDTDSDGKSDSEEVFAGTDPLDAKSILEVTRVAYTAEGAIVEWLVVPGKKYQAYVSSDLTAWSALGEAVPAEASDASLSLVDAEASALDKSFYRVEVLP